MTQELTKYIGDSIDSLTQFYSPYMQVEGAVFTPLPITSEEHCSNLVAFLLDVKHKKEEIEDQRKQYTKPLDDQKKAIMGIVKPLLDTLDNIEKAAKKGVLVYKNEQEQLLKAQQERLLLEARALEAKQRAALMKKLEKEQTKDNPSLDKLRLFREQMQNVSVLVPILETTIAKPEGIQFKKLWRMEVTDQAAIPREYLQPNEDLIMTLCRKSEGNIPIPGIRFFQIDSISEGK